MTESELVTACNDKKIKKIVKQAKAEAYNDCIKKLAEITTLNIYLYSNSVYVIETQALDNLLKELRELL